MLLPQHAQQHPGSRIHTLSQAAEPLTQPAVHVQQRQYSIVVLRGWRSSAPACSMCLDGRQRLRSYARCMPLHKERVRHQQNEHRGVTAAVFSSWQVGLDRWMEVISA